MTTSKYEICIATFDPHTETRLPPLEHEQVATELAKTLAKFYPGALIEIAHDGMRRGI